MYKDNKVQRLVLSQDSPMVAKTGVQGDKKTGKRRYCETDGGKSEVARRGGEMEEMKR